MCNHHIRDNPDQNEKNRINKFQPTLDCNHRNNRDHNPNNQRQNIVSTTIDQFHTQNTITQKITPYTN